MLLSSLWIGCTNVGRTTHDYDQSPGATGPQLEAETLTPVPPATDCPGGIDALELAVEELPHQLLGRLLRVELSEPTPALVTCTLEAAPPVWEQLVPLRASWRYLDDGADPGPDWALPSFDDSSWSVGEQPFTFGMSGATALAPGAEEPHETTWFRTTFEVDDPASVAQLRISVRHDDGLVVHVNGAEAFRDNVPVVSPRLGPAEVVLSDHDLALTPGLLLAGQNTIAVELHQVPGSSDASFHLRLTALVERQPAPEVHLVEGVTPSAEHAIPIYGLLPDATYTCVARSADLCGGAVTATLVTRPLDRPVPRLALHPDHRAPTWGAYTLLNHQRPCADDHSNRLVIVDPEGQPRWVHELDLNADSTIDIESTLVGSDGVLWAGGQEPQGAPQLVGLDGEQRYLTSYPGSDQDLYHHDVERDPTGRLLGLANHGDDGITRPGFDLVEHDPATGEVTWRWSAAEAFARGELAPGAPDDVDPWHPNAFTSVDDADGQGVEVSLLYSNEIIRVDRATGQVQWHLGQGRDFRLLAPDGSELPDDQWFDHIHGLNRYGDLLYMYDNGWTSEHSRAVALRLDTAARTATLAWSWTELGWYEKRWGDVDELPNGAVLIAMARSCSPTDHPGALVEVDPATGDVPWRLDFLDLDDSTYRAQRLDGCAVFANSRWCPAIAERVAELSSP